MTGGTLLSIVTVHFQDPAGLSATLESIRSARLGSGTEWVVVDGGTELSDSGAREAVESARAFADVFTSGPDHGIYDAMNRGVQLSSGRYLLFLNAGDTLHPDFDPQCLSGLPEPPPDMVWGISWDCPPGGPPYPVHARPPWWLRYGPALSHQAIFFRRGALGDAPYDTNLRIAADYDLICRLYRGGGGVVRVDVPVCVYALGGRSAGDPLETLREEARVRGAHFHLPGWLNSSIMHFKHALWRLSRRLPRLRRALRGRI